MTHSLFVVFFCLVDWKTALEAVKSLSGPEEGEDSVSVYSYLLFDSVNMRTQFFFNSFILHILSDLTIDQLPKNSIIHDTVLCSSFLDFCGSKNKS